MTTARDGVRLVVSQDRASVLVGASPFADPGFVIIRLEERHTHPTPVATGMQLEMTPGQTRALVAALMRELAMSEALPPTPTTHKRVRCEACRGVGTGSFAYCAECDGRGWVDTPATSTPERTE